MSRIVKCAICGKELSAINSMCVFNEDCEDIHFCHECYHKEKAADKLWYKKYEKSTRRHFNPAVLFGM